MDLRDERDGVKRALVFAQEREGVLAEAGTEENRADEELYGEVVRMRFGEGLRGGEVG